MASMIKAPRSTHTGKLRVLLIACGFVLLSLLNDILYENVWLYNLQSPQYSTKHLGDGDDGVRRTYDIQEEASLQSYIPSFIPVSQLNFDRQDSFAASWWQTVDRFLDCDLDLIENVEGDVFVVINQAGNGEDDVVMTKDFLDFSVEHLSKWWRLGKVEAQAAMRLKEYVKKYRFVKQDGMMSSTLAIIPYGVQKKDDENNVWRAALAATIVSLVQHGVARIVVVGYYELDAVLTHEVFSFLVGTEMDHDEDDESFETFFQSTELAYVHTSNVESKHIKVNIPRGALVGLKEAFQGETEEPHRYLGTADPKRFKYVFMTESDQILQARMSQSFLDEMDKGGILLPHRLQPVPHRNDTESFDFSLKNFPPESWGLVELNPNVDSCCDTGNRHPGFYNRTCHDFWWKCGFKNGKFDHYQGYQFIRLLSGTGVVNVAATEHGRPCEPRRNQRGCQEDDDDRIAEE